MAAADVAAEVDRRIEAKEHGHVNVHAKIRRRRSSGNDYATGMKT